jgi:hypothetical protein
MKQKDKDLIEQMMWRQWHANPNGILSKVFERFKQLADVPDVPPGPETRIIAPRLTDEDIGRIVDEVKKAVTFRVSFTGAGGGGGGEPPTAGTGGVGGAWGPPRCGARQVYTNTVCSLEEGHPNEHRNGHGLGTIGWTDAFVDAFVKAADGGSKFDGSRSGTGPKGKTFVVDVGAPGRTSPGYTSSSRGYDSPPTPEDEDVMALADTKRRERDAEEFERLKVSPKEIANAAAASGRPMTPEEVVEHKVAAECCSQGIISTYRRAFEDVLTDLRVVVGALQHLRADGVPIAAMALNAIKTKGL